ncbi:hypothetical protein NEAUS03_2498 [Nematocida ausubeli]|nr:hypothetical protein NEAUS03_2498 [Nematocida ausubeli]
MDAPKDNEQGGDAVEDKTSLGFMFF